MSSSCGNDGSLLTTSKHDEHQQSLLEELTTLSKENNKLKTEQLLAIQHLAEEISRLKAELVVKTARIEELENQVDGMSKDKTLLCDRIDNLVLNHQNAMSELERQCSVSAKYLVVNPTKLVLADETRSDLAKELFLAETATFLDISFLGISKINVLFDSKIHTKPSRTKEENAEFCWSRITNKGPTIVLVFSDHCRCVCGGLTSVSWPTRLSKDEQNKRDENAFLFSLIHTNKHSELTQQRFHLQSGLSQQALWIPESTWRTGPCFGDDELNICFEDFTVSPNGIVGLSCANNSCYNLPKSLFFVDNEFSPLDRVIVGTYKLLTK